MPLFVNPSRACPCDAGSYSRAPEWAVPVGRPAQLRPEQVLITPSPFSTRDFIDSIARSLKKGWIWKGGIWDEANISWPCAVRRHARDGGYERQRRELLFDRPDRRDLAPGPHEPDHLDVAARNLELHIRPQQQHLDHLRQRPRPPLTVS